MAPLPNNPGRRKDAFANVTARCKEFGFRVAEDAILFIKQDKPSPTSGRKNTGVTLLAVPTEGYGAVLLRPEDVAKNPAAKRILDKEAGATLPRHAEKVAKQVERLCYHIARLDKAGGPVTINRLASVKDKILGGRKPIAALLEGLTKNHAVQAIAVGRGISYQLTDAGVEFAGEGGRSE